MQDLLAKIPKPIRDAIEGLFAVVVVYLLTFADGYLAQNPAAFGSATAIVVVALGILRRWLVPAEPTPAQLTNWKFEPSPLADIDRPTPALGTPAVFQFAPDQARDDDDFIGECSKQIADLSPAKATGYTFDPATIIAILTWLFANRSEILAWVAKIKTWLAFLFRPKLKRAIVDAIASQTPRYLGRTHDLVPAFEAWLVKADRQTLERVQRIAMARR